jgi:7-cyano-7-deazaguanine reductase
MTEQVSNSADDSSGLIDRLPLGKHSDYVDTYSPELLCPIPRKLSRANLGLDNQTLPFVGVDIWNAYELSWLNAKGKPEIAMVQFYFPSDSDAIVESKSFKLYLNSFNQTHIDNVERLREMLVSDLTKACGAAVDVNVILPEQWPNENLGSLAGVCLDNLDIQVGSYQPQASLLQAASGAGNVVREQLYSHLFRSLCPVTGQPDWGSVSISYSGLAISRPDLLAYLVGFRQHQDFHEQCVERIFLDVLAQCKPSELTVGAHFIRRGGLDINPYRSTNASLIPWVDSCSCAHIRLPRQ